MSKQANLGAGCLTLFGLPFAAAGAWMTWSLATMLGTAWAAQSWVERPATLIKVELETHHGESTTHEVIAEYRYDFEGQQHTGDRVGLWSQADNVGDYHKRMHRRLAAAKSAGQTVPCYVDPTRPESSLLDRNLRWKAVLFHLPFVICFNLAGFGMIGGGWYGANKLRRQEARRAQFPEEPWRYRTDWEAGEIRSSDARSLVWPAIIALFWNGLSVPAFVLLVFQDDAEWWVVLLVGIFPLIGAGMAGNFLYRLARYLRYGRSTLRMAATPGVVGGELAGVVLAPSAAPANGPYRVRLACLRTVERRDSDGDTVTSQTAVWEDLRIVERTLHDPRGRHGVPIRFVIPSDGKPTDTQADLPIEWRLTVTAKTPGPDYKAEFDVPVYRTADSRDDVEADAAPLTEYEAEESLAEKLARERVRFRHDEATDQLRVACPPGRIGVTGAFVLLFGVAMIGAAIGMAVWMDEWVKWLFIAVFGGIGPLMAYGGLELLLGCVDLEIDGDEWRVRSGWWGWRRETRFRARDVRSVSAKQAVSSSSSGEETQKWNHLVARLRDKRKINVVTYLKDRAAERELLAELRRLAKSRRG